MQIILSDLECELAKKVGAQRQADSDMAKRHNAHGTSGGVELHIQGAAAELAYAKGMNVYPSGFGQRLAEDNDVGGVQIRGRTQHWHDLYLWKRDPDDAPFVLVTGTMPEFILHGYIFGDEAKQAKYYTEAWGKGNFPREDCYIVPQTDLHPLENLQKWYSAIRTAT